VSILSERRVHAPHGLLGGEDGARGSNILLKQDGRRVFIGGKADEKGNARNLEDLCVIEYGLGRRTQFGAGLGEICMQQNVCR
jgi:N-methylhydantoinase B/oxoprolinase/acetone carboxylase alpha subunit